MRALTPDDQPGLLGPAGQINPVGDLTDLTVLALGSVLVKRGDPGVLGGSAGSPRGPARSAHSQPRTADSPHGSNRYCTLWANAIPPLRVAALRSPHAVAPSDASSTTYTSWDGEEGSGNNELKAALGRHGIAWLASR